MNISDNTVRPQSFDDYIGQEQAKTVLKILCKAAKKQGKPIAHLLLSGAPGLGKTTIARIVAANMGGGANLIEMVGSNLEEPKILQAQLAGLKPHDIIFIDEIHSINRTVEEVLYSAMEDGILSYVPENNDFNGIMRAIGMGNSASRAVTVKLPPFTLIGATTLAGLVSAPLRSRFIQTLHLEPYTVPELQRIIKGTAKRIAFHVPDNVALEMAKRGRNTARLAVGHLLWLKEYCVAYNSKPSMDSVRKAFLLKGVDENGLTQQDKDYLALLITASAPVGINTIAASLGESERTISESIEPYLLREGYIRRQPRGRIAEQKAYALLREKAA